MRVIQVLTISREKLFAPDGVYPFVLWLKVLVKIVNNFIKNIVYFKLNRE